MDATILLVDGLHGHNAVAQLRTHYADRLRVVESPRGDYLHVVDYSHIYEEIEEGSVYVRDNEGTHYRVQFENGDIIAVHPDAEWCDTCECYHLVSGNVTRYQVLEALLPALMNGDMSGLTDLEASQLVSFEDTETDGIENWHWSVFSDHYDEFAECDITDVRGRTVELHLVNMDRA